MKTFTITLLIVFFAAHSSGEHSSSPIDQPLIVDHTTIFSHKYNWNLHILFNKFPRLGCPLCHEGKVCAGNWPRKRCVTPMIGGQSCGHDPYWVCAQALPCTNGKCVQMNIPEGQDCTAAGSSCVETTVCVGIDTKKFCKKPMLIGQQCGQDPYWVCLEGLQCLEGTCKAPGTTVPDGGVCTKLGSTCVEGTVCVGPDHLKICKKPMLINQQCGQDPYWVCLEGLQCLEGTCKAPGTTVPDGGVCSKLGSTCVEGTVCVGPDHLKICKKPMLINQQCGQDPYWVCLEGLQCLEGTCKAPGTTVPDGGVCSKLGSTCVEGTVCVGPDHLKICKKPMLINQQCGQDPYWVCLEGLQCLEGTCKATGTTVPDGGVCSKLGSTCVEGTECVGPDHLKICKKPMLINQQCGQDPYWVCLEGLECLDGTCKDPHTIVPDHGDCTKIGNVCLIGTSCVGPADRKKCEILKKFGEQCGQDPYLVCENSLDCEGGICVLPLQRLGRRANCSALGSLCGDGLLCAGHGDQKRCVRGRKVGKKCGGRNGLRICHNSLTCKEGMCRGPIVGENEDCSSRLVECNVGMKCMNAKSANKKKICIKH